MKKNYVNLLLLCATFFIVSCGGSSSGDSANSEKKEEIETFVEKEFTYPIPTSFEVARMINDANTSYSPEIVNDIAKVDDYVTTWQKAVNLGVYGADLSYAATFGWKQETIDYLGASKKLIEELNITSAFNVSMASRIEANIEDLDSLILIVTESFYDTYNYLNQNGEEKTSILVIAGSVFEGLYITCNLIEQSENKAELMGVLGQQRLQVMKLVELMEVHQDDENVNKVLPRLRYLKLVYDQLGESTEMTQGQFNDIAKSVKEMRQEMVG